MERLFLPLFERAGVKFPRHDPRSLPFLGTEQTRVCVGHYDQSTWISNYHFESRHTIYSYFDFGLKSSSFRLPYQHPSSSADCARELFKWSNGSASLVDCTQKKFFGWGVWIFCEWRHKWSSFGILLSHVPWPRAQPLVRSVSLKFSLETRLESEFFEPLINFLAFLVQKLWSKINKLINYLIYFWTRNPSRSSKVSKDLDCSIVSSKNFSEILPPNDWRPGPGKVGQSGLKFLHLWRHSQKTCTPQTKNFFECRLEDLLRLLTLQSGP